MKYLLNTLFIIIIMIIIIAIIILSIVIIIITIIIIIIIKQVRVGARDRKAGGHVRHVRHEGT